MAGVRLHLLKRSSVYYWRRRLPASIAHVLGKSHLMISTRLAGLIPASRLARRLSVILDRFLTQMEQQKRAPTSEEITSLLSEIDEAVNERYELGRAVRADIGGENEDREIPAFARMEINSNEDIDRYRSSGSRVHRAHPDEAAKQHEHDQATAVSIDFWDPDHLREQWREALSRNDLAPIRPFLDELLAAKGFVLDPDSIAYRLFAVKSLRAGIRALEFSGATVSRAIARIDAR